MHIVFGGPISISTLPVDRSANCIFLVVAELIAEEMAIVDIR